MSSANFFSLLEDNTSSDVVEIAKKKIEQQQKQQKPAQPKEAPKEKAPQTTGEKQPQQKPQQATQGEKPQGRPQTSQENRGRGRGQQSQRPQTSGDNRGEGRSEGRGRGRGRGERQPGDQQRGERQNRPPRVRKEGDNAVSTVDTTTENGPRKTKSHHAYDPDAPRRGRQFDRSVSGTGRGRGLKKGGEGAHNWGKEGDQDVRRGDRVFRDKKGRSEGKVVVKGEDAPVEGVTAPLKEGETVETPTETEAKTEGTTTEAKVEEKKEEVDNTLTLEEYQKQQAEKRKLLPNFKPEATPVVTPAPTTVKAAKKEKTPKVGEPVSIQEFLKDRADELNAKRESERERGGRGRGGPRGSRGGNTRGKRQDAPDLKDQKAFPSLSGK